MHFKTITYARLAKTVRITLSRPEVHNAFNETVIRELTRAFRDAGRENGARVIVLSGKGSSFSAGADINWLKKANQAGYKRNLADSSALSALFYGIYSHPLPVVGRINGPAYGGGCGLAAVCDISVASTDATFTLSELKLGIIPAVIAPYIVKRIGEGKTRSLFLAGEKIGAERAALLGLVDHAVEPGALDDKVEEIISKLLTSGPRAISETKKLLKRLPGMTIEAASRHTAKLIAKLRASEEGQEGTCAFLEKRKPKWTE